MAIWWPLSTDSRINPAFFYPGVGYGGSCFPKDVKALIKTGEENHVSMNVVKATDAANDFQKTVLYEKVKKHFKNLNGLTLSIWGLAFKPRTDDVREAPAFEIIEKLVRDGVRIQTFDPAAMPNTKKRFPEIKYCKSAYEALENSDGLIVVTE